MTDEANDGSTLIIIATLIVGALIGVMSGILGTLCVAYCFWKRDTPIIPEPGITERIVEVEKPVANEFLVPQEIYVGQTKSCYAYHIKYSKECHKLPDLVQRGVTVKRFTPCTYCFPSKPGSKREWHTL